MSPPDFIKPGARVWWWRQSEPARRFAGTIAGEPFKPMGFSSLVVEVKEKQGRWLETIYADLECVEERKDVEL